MLSGDATPPGRVLIFDDDHFYLGPVLAAELRKRANEVVLLTSAGRPCEYGAYTAEQDASIAQMLAQGVEIITNSDVQRVEAGRVHTACVHSGRETSLAADWVVPLTRREPNDALYHELLSAQPAGVESIVRSGDCEAPGMIVNAVYSGYRTGIELDTTPSPAKRERP